METFYESGFQVVAILVLETRQVTRYRIWWICWLIDGICRVFNLNSDTIVFPYLIASNELKSTPLWLSVLPKWPHDVPNSIYGKTISINFIFARFGVVALAWIQFFPPFRWLLICLHLELRNSGIIISYSALLKCGIRNHRIKHAHECLIELMWVCVKIE